MTDVLQKTGFEWTNSRDLELTLVANELATSFAPGICQFRQGRAGSRSLEMDIPMFQASSKAKMAHRANR